MVYTFTKVKRFEPRGEHASRLRQRKYELLRRFRIPEHALPGSLVLTRTRCGKPTCRCATGEHRHTKWTLTFMVDGKKRVETIPAELLDEIRPLVLQGRELKDAVAEVFALNAQLLALWHRQQPRRKKR